MPKTDQPAKRKVGRPRKASKEQRTDISELKRIDYQRGDVKHQVGNI